MLRDELPALLQDRSLSVATVLTLYIIILFAASSLLFPLYTTYSLLQIYNIVQYQIFVSHYKHSTLLTMICNHTVSYSSFHFLALMLYVPIGRQKSSNIQQQKFNIVADT